MMLIWLVVLTVFLAVVVVDLLVEARAAAVEDQMVLVKKAAGEAAPAALVALVKAAAQAGRISSPSHRHPSLRNGSTSSLALSSRVGPRQSHPIGQAGRHGPTSRHPISAGLDDPATPATMATSCCAPSSRSGSSNRSSATVSATGLATGHNRKPTAGEAATDDQP